MARCFSLVLFILIFPLVTFAQEIPQTPTPQQTTNLERAKEILQTTPKETPQEPASIASQGAGMMKALSITLGLFFIGVFIFKKFSKNPQSGFSQGKVISRVFLSPKTSVFHIEISGRELFVTVSDSGVSMITAHLNSKKEFDA